MSRNMIEDIGGEDFADMIRINTSLIRINLSYNQMTDLTGRALIRAINYNDTL